MGACLAMERTAEQQQIFGLEDENVYFSEQELVEVCQGLLASQT